MVKLRDDAGEHDDQPESEALLEQLKVLESNAKAEGKGVWSTTEDGRIESRYENPSEPLEFLEKYKGKPINCEPPTTPDTQVRNWWKPKEVVANSNLSHH